MFEGEELIFFFISTTSNASLGMYTDTVPTLCCDLQRKRRRIKSRRKRVRERGRKKESERGRKKESERKRKKEGMNQVKEKRRILLVTLWILFSLSWIVFSLS